MPLKPFPLAINIGNDLAHIGRFRRYAENSEILTRWASKTFTRLEWGLIARQCTLYSGEPIAPDFRYLPVPTSDRSKDLRGIKDRGSRNENLARFFAGRYELAFEKGIRVCDCLNF